MQILRGLLFRPAIARLHTKFSELPLKPSASMLIFPTLQSGSKAMSLEGRLQELIGYVGR
jgi:phosphotransacetylase